jgi:transposase
MAKQRRAYSEEFKRDAVRRLAAGEHALSYIARDLGINPNLLGTWRRKYGTISTPKTATKPPVSLEDEVARLRRENASLKEDREILKKPPRFLPRTR